MSGFNELIEKYREDAFSERDKGNRFERLMKVFLQTAPKYTGQFSDIWLWNEFPSRGDFGGKDTGIDIVCRTIDGDYWAVQCKCYAKTARIDKPSVDTFLSTSSKEFSDVDDANTLVPFLYRLWIDTTTKGFNSEAENTVHNQKPPVGRISLFDLENSFVDWEKLENGISGKDAQTEKFPIKEHQTIAIDTAHEYFKQSDRGKLIMACGTGKTFTALKIAEKETDNKGLVLFLVPSIALLGQALNEWYAQSTTHMHSICICSDSHASKSNKKNDFTSLFAIDLAQPASTNIESITRQYRRAIKHQAKDGGMIVVFSTYQSIEVIMTVQKTLNEKQGDTCIFDLIICDEAHRTTGIVLKDSDESAFVRVHTNDNIQAKKRMYMTATPRLYSSESQIKARESEAILCSMDDPEYYGEEIYRIGFGEAVEKELLSDYKVIVLTLDENQLSPALKESITNRDDEIKADDALKLIGCINALSKITHSNTEVFASIDPEPMHSAVAFCQTIAVSKATRDAMNTCREVYFETLSEVKRSRMVEVEADHVDGTMGASIRNLKLQKLKDSKKETNKCNILMNVRCLSEGVDVPSLDAVLFLSARNSQIDVVQSVGRVMRRAEGKNYGYIIIPVVIPSGVEPEKVLGDSDRFKVVWTILNALRAHDDRFNAIVNKIDLNKKKPSQIVVMGTDIGGSDFYDDSNSNSDSDSNTKNKKSDLEKQLELQFEELHGIIYAKMVEKCGDRLYWENWAGDIAKIAEKHIAQIGDLLKNSSKVKTAFDRYLAGLHKNINPSVTESDAIEMLAQHIITEPVFDALFENYSFVQNNPISKSMQGIVSILNEKTDSDDSEKLKCFYDSVRSRASNIDNVAAKQKIIIELYDKFFKTAFPKVVEKLGIVYTPIEVVDFIIHSVEDVLQQEFNRSMSDENVHILDPFTGTGTFITRLLQSGIIQDKDIERKYANEIHANEIVLLAYYIASINIENVYHDEIRLEPKKTTYRIPDDALYAADSSSIDFATIQDKNSYRSFKGICLTDTFQLGETDESKELFLEIFQENSSRVRAQKNAPLRIIIGNPPYSIGQKSANDNAQNQGYKKLESQIADSYAKGTNATNKNSLYDSYIKAFRWASERLDPKNGGIIAFVSNAGWLEGNAMDGFRKCLEDEFQKIYIFNLRGNQRTSGELSRKEGGKIFGSGSRTPIAITILIKKPSIRTQKAIIQYCDIGDYLSQKEKLKKIQDTKSVCNELFTASIITPNEYGDWIAKRNDLFLTFIPLGTKEKGNTSHTFFVPYYSRGIATSRDSWCYNFSKKELEKNVQSMINFYNSQVEDYKEALKINNDLKVMDFINKDSTKFTWDRTQREDIPKSKKYLFNIDSIRKSDYRPFCGQNVYFNRSLNNCVYQQPKLFPTAEHSNIVICVSGVGSSKDFTSLISNYIPCLDYVEKSQCFPLYWYEENTSMQNDLFATEAGTYTRRDGITDFILKHSREKYGPKVLKEDIFYYVYGILHSSEYRTKFSTDLKKMLPRIPLVLQTSDFWAFCAAGKKLAKLHLEYEQIAPYEGLSIRGADSNNFTVHKMKFLAKDKKDTIIYNNAITICNIPPKAYEYTVNGKSAIEWIIDRYQVTIHTDSQIKNDPNDWAREHNEPRYILDLLLSVINVSVQTVDIVANLPTVDWENE